MTLRKRLQIVLSFLSPIFLSPFFSNAQTFTISGKVTDAEGKPAENVSVVVSGC